MFETISRCVSFYIWFFLTYLFTNFPHLSPINEPFPVPFWSFLYPPQISISSRFTPLCKIKTLTKINAKARAISQICLVELVCTFLMFSGSGSRLSPLTTPPCERSPQMTLSLQEILIVGSAVEQAKFSELTMDMFRWVVMRMWYESDIN